MIYKIMKYKQINGEYSQQFIIQETENGSKVIPSDEANIDYQRYLQWVAEGNTPIPPDEPTA